MSDFFFDAETEVTNGSAGSSRRITITLQLGIDDFNLMIIVPGRFARGDDDRCHSSEARKAFWTDIANLEQRIEDLKRESAS